MPIPQQQTKQKEQTESKEYIKILELIITDENDYTDLNTNEKLHTIKNNSNHIVNDDYGEVLVKINLSLLKSATITSIDNLLQKTPDFVNAIRWIFSDKQAVTDKRKIIITAHGGPGYLMAADREGVSIKYEELEKLANYIFKLCLEKPTIPNDKPVYISSNGKINGKQVNLTINISACFAADLDSEGMSVLLVMSFLTRRYQFLNVEITGITGLLNSEHVMITSHDGKLSQKYVISTNKIEGNTEKQTLPKDFLEQTSKSFFPDNNYKQKEFQTLFDKTTKPNNFNKLLRFLYKQSKHSINTKTLNEYLNKIDLYPGISYAVNHELVKHKNYKIQDLIDKCKRTKP